MGTQTAIAEKIRAKRADYTLAVKENQPKPYEEVSEYFGDEELLKQIKNNGGYKITKEKAHSSIEICEYYQCSDIKWMAEKSRWKGLKSIGMVRKTIKKGDKTVVEKRYYISSLANDIDLFARTIREHWSVEVMHWHLDVTFKENDNTTKDKIAAQNLNIIKKWCLSILKRFESGKKKMSLKKKRFCISLDTRKYFQQIMAL